MSVVRKYLAVIVQRERVYIYSALGMNHVCHQKEFKQLSEPMTKFNSRYMLVNVITNMIRDLTRGTISDVTALRWQNMNILFGQQRQWQPVWTQQNVMRNHNLMRFIVFTKRFQESLLIAEYAWYSIYKNKKTLPPTPAMKKIQLIGAIQLFDRNAYVNIDKLYQLVHLSFISLIMM